MKRVLILIITILISSCSSKEEVVFYENGYIFNGEGFEKKDFIIKNGNFFFDNLIKVHKVIDLTNKYVVPPFGDAHTHNFDNLDKFDSIYKAYIKEGVFYVQVLNNHHTNYLVIKDSLNRAGKIDAVFAHGGITSTGGHPHNLYESQALNYSWRAMFDPIKKEKILASRLKENDAYYIIDNLEQLDKKWSVIMDKNPDFLKVYILNTQDRLERLQNKQVGSYGISEEVLKELVNKAKKTGIKIVAHVETVKDFEIALKYGVKNYGHMPGYGAGIGDVNLEKLELSDSLLNQISIRNIAITPTVSFTKYYAQKWDGSKMSTDSLLLNKKYAFLSKQIRKLVDHNVSITLGADQNNVTLYEELDDIIAMGVFSNLELINILINTPKSIFPNREIGKIAEGYEASFLVLEENPLKDIQAIKKIVKRVKNGVEL